VKTSHPAALGEALQDLDTPCLVLDREAFVRNHDRLMHSMKGLGVAVRPHAKSHKCPEIARHQIRNGAVGICCQKVSEAEAFADEGIENILVANEFFGQKKVHRYLALASRLSAIACCVDHPDQVAALSMAGEQSRIRLRLLVEIDVGQGRCGVQDLSDAVALASQIAQSPWLELAGIQGYHGSAQHFRSYSERLTAISSAADRIWALHGELGRLGIDAPWRTGGGTGSYAIEAKSGAYTEVQPGSYVFMDADYQRNQPAPDAQQPVFEHALYVAATVMSRPSPDRAVLDAGLKSFSVDSGLPVLDGPAGCTYVKASDEHGVVSTKHSSSLQLGDVLRVIPGHCDPTVNLYDHIVVMSEGRVVDVWPISARGRSC
jgi:D-serine deaminase-like pyridoxal phosphate-dependent protein